jgi:hypothetical protein
MLKLTKAKQIKTNIEYFSRFLQVLNNGDGNKLLNNEAATADQGLKGSVR